MILKDDQGVAEYALILMLRSALLMLSSAIMELNLASIPTEAEKGQVVKDPSRLWYHTIEC